MESTDLFDAREAYYNAENNVERRIAKYNLRAAIYGLRATVERLRAAFVPVLQTLRQMLHDIAEAVGPVTVAADNTK